MGFDLEQVAIAMNAIVDRHLERDASRDIVGKSRVPLVLRQVARDGWPPGFVPDPERVAFWKAWLLERRVFTTNTTTESEWVMAVPEPVETQFPPRRPYRWAVLNQKGGVGKTGLTQGVAGALAERGRRVLLLDLDPQGHLTTEALSVDEIEDGRPTLARVLTGEYDGPLTDLIINHSVHKSGGRIDIIPTSPEMFLVVAKMYKGRGRRLEHVLLEKLVEGLPEGSYDHVGMDCPPSLDILTDNALVAAEGVLIPVQPARTSVRALRLLLEQIAVLEEELRLDQRNLLGLVFSLYRRPLPGIAKYVAAELESFATPESPDIPPLPVLAHLPLATSVEEAWMQGITVVDYQPRSNLAGSLRRVAIRLDVEAGLAPAADWDRLPALPSLGPEPEPHTDEHTEPGRGRGDGSDDSVTTLDADAATGAA